MGSNNTSVLVAVQSSDIDRDELTEHIEELSFLAQTAHINVLREYVQKLQHPDAQTFVKKGKLHEIRDAVFSHDIDRVIFDGDLSPSQLKNVERVFNPKTRDQKVIIYDRSLLILNIFLDRARTARARIQVQLAMNQYLLPRLTRMWTHLERQRGGIGSRGGAGEKEIETDRRNIRHQINVLKQKLKKVDRQSRTQRKARGNMPRVSLVGYTNAGKSTLMRRMAKTDVKIENKLFATVDTLVRKVVWKGNPFLLSDTVGFIRKLPSHLIDSFKSTLDEVREADVLLHVVDVSHPYHYHHIETVNQMLLEMGAQHISTILVLNKFDVLQSRKDCLEEEDMRHLYREYGFDEPIIVSAVTGLYMHKLEEMLSGLLYSKDKKSSL